VHRFTLPCRSCFVSPFVDSALVSRGIVFRPSCKADHVGSWLPRLKSRWATGDCGLCELSCHVKGLDLYLWIKYMSFSDKWQCIFELIFYLRLWVCMLGCVPTSSEKVKKWHWIGKLITNMEDQHARACSWRKIWLTQ
jgi:hypothetical protein